MTGESKSETERWVEDKGARYAYVYDKGGKAARAMNVKGIPAAALLDPSGKVVWRGHPGQLDSTTIEASLAGALPMPLFDFPKGASGVAKAIKKQQLGKALEAATDYSGERSKEILEAVEGIISARVSKLNSRFTLGDYQYVMEHGRELIEQLDGLEHVKAINDKLDFIGFDDGAQRILKGQAAITKALDKRLKKKKDADKVIASLEKIVEDYSGTYAATAAEEAIEKVRAMREALKK